MSTRARPRSFTRVFKLEMVRQWEANERNGAQLVREHELTRSMLHRWRAEHRALGEAAFRGAMAMRYGQCAPDQPFPCRA